MKKLLTSAIALTILASAGAASAQPGQRHDDRRQEQKFERKIERKIERRQERYERRAERRYKAARYQAPRGYQARAWRHGERLPPAYRTRAYVVDYRTYRLAPPPRGYQYVRVGNDVALTAVTTGLIASVVQQLFQ